MPRTTPGSAAKRARGISSRIWFTNGFWWFRSAHDGSVREISSVMRRLRYDAADLARELGVGERSFHRLVKDEISLSVGFWLRMLRAAEFRHRLRAAEPIKRLAWEYGFKRHTDFCVEFKRWYGMTPTAFLKNLKSSS